MEGLRQSVMAPAGGTILMLFGCFSAMSEMVKTRYAVKDEKGRPVLPHPYSPWVPVDPKYQLKADAAYRAFKMFENVKEWTVLSLPLKWLFWLYGGTLPYVTQPMVDGAVVLSSIVYLVGTNWYIFGYIQGPEKRLKGFKLRRRVCEFWLFGSAGSFLWALGRRIGNVALGQ
mmetsp:Transcript_4775/g.7456  ORF Transcript_4775/g.7456 Transcript_4775/m.7456 type:complete len:172 (-) Transcript_4775:279-794(-)